MKTSYIAFFLACLVIFVHSSNPEGGGECTLDTQCNFPEGTCHFGPGLNGTGVCLCSSCFAGSFCYYQQKSKNLAGGLQFIALAGVGGIGEFVLERDEVAIPQLLLTLSVYFVAVFYCIFVCCLGMGAGGDDEGCAAGGYACIVCLYFIAGCCYLAGVIWSIVTGAQILNGDVDDGNGYTTC